MITDSYDIKTEGMFDLGDFYGERKQLVNTCLIIFSKEIQQHLLDNFECEEIGMIGSCRETVPIYRMTYKGTEIAFYLSMLGSSLASSNCIEAQWLTGAKNYVMFGSCGSLDSGKTDGKFIIPTHSYRGEGCSYYYAPAEDYIRIKNSDRLAEIFDELKLPYVRGRVWTVDSMLRETYGLVAKRREEGCIAVEMELAGVQAVCDFYGMQLYDFLEAGDVLGAQGYDKTNLYTANHSLGKLYIGLETAVLLEKN